MTCRPEHDENAGRLVLVVPGEGMGRGSVELGGLLVRTFFHTLGEVSPTPDTIIFYNAGVRLVLDDSPILEDLRALAERGVEVLACGTCLKHFEVMDRIAVGVVSNMYAIAERKLAADKVISL
jgi:selenium metabolism protein YedF